MEKEILLTGRKSRKSDSWNIQIPEIGKCTLTARSTDDATFADVFRDKVLICTGAPAERGELIEAFQNGIHAVLEMAKCGAFDETGKTNVIQFPRNR